MVEPGASLHLMSKSGLTPEEQETIRKSKDPSVTMTANGTSHTTEEATTCVSDLDMFGEVQLLKEITLSRMGENIECENSSHILLVVPGV